MWSFANSAEISCQVSKKWPEIREHYLIYMFTKTSFAMKCFFWTYKMHFCQLCNENFARSLRKYCSKTEEDIEKYILFSKKVLVMKTLLWTCKGSSENRAQKLSAKNQNPEIFSWNFFRGYILIRKYSSDKWNTNLTKLRKNATESPKRSALMSESG